MKTTPVEKVLAFLMAAGAATSTALTVAFVAHDELGLSRQEIRIPAVIAAAAIAMLMVTEFLSRKLRKPK
jgi:hypothetical protein